MSVRMVVTVCPAALLGLCLLARPDAARAQPVGSAAPDLDAAKKHYGNAEQAMQRGAYAEAARAYEQAYAASKDPVLFYKIGDAHQKAGDCDAAVTYFERYLAEGNPDEEFRALAERRVAACKSGASAAPPAGAAGSTGEGAAGEGAAGGESGEGGEIGDTVARDASDVPTGPGEAPSFLDGPTTWQRNAAWISVGIAISFVVTGAILGVSASARADDIDTLIELRDLQTGEPERFEGNVAASYDDLVSEGRTLDRLSKVSLGLGGAAVAAAVVFFVLDSQAAPADVAAHRSRLHPTVGAGTVGVTAGWEF